jgi:outer membrane protein OmpA-like peptidoglycan-associated protein
MYIIKATQHTLCYRNMKVFTLLGFCLLFISQVSAQEIPERVKLKNDPTVSPSIIEKSATLSLDGKSMIFLSNSEGSWKFYEAQKHGSVWSSPIAIDAINNHSESKGTLHSPSLSSDNSKLYFAANFEADGGGMNIYFSPKGNGEWQAPIMMDKPINTEEYEGSPSITPDERTMYFVRRNTASENKDYACFQIWASEKDAEGKWIEPFLLPKPINLDCEECPTIAPDGKTLYFSSIREYEDENKVKSKDGYDLYYATQYANKVWYHPVLLNELNTDEDDMFPAIDVFGKELYYSSGDEKKKNPSKWFGSVYKAELPRNAKPAKNLLLSGKITDLNTESPMLASIKVQNPYTSEVLGNYTTNSEFGDYQLVLTEGKRYRLDISKEGYSHQFINLDFRKSDGEVKSKLDASIYSTVQLLMNVFDNEVYSPLEAKISIKNKETGKKVEKAEIKRISKGRYQFTLPIGQVYKFDFVAENYKPHTYEFDMKEVVQFDEYEKEVELTIKKRPIEITIRDSETKESLPVDFTIQNLNRKEDFSSNAFGFKDGKFKVEFREGDAYELTVNPKGYAFYNTTFDLTKNKSKEILVELDSIKKDKKLVLNNITFEYNSADLQAESFEELDRLVQFLSENTDVNVEISAHTDNKGTPKYNLKLSDKRAISVVNYLAENGIAETRMVAKGYGETEPLHPNDTEENRKMNRRVEMKIVQLAEEE